MPNPTTNQIFEIALQHHQAERLQEAETYYRQVLQNNPDHSEALNLLGTLSYQTGHGEVAKDLINHAIRINPANPIFHNNLGMVYKALNRLDEAVACYKKALELEPNFALAHNNLGDTLKEAKDFDGAAACYKRILSINRNDFKVWSNYIELALRHKISIDREALRPIVDSTAFFQRFQIEITTDCNLKCAECPRTVGMANGGWTSKHMPIDEFRQIINHSPYATVAVLQGVGEPTLHPQLGEFISITKSSGKFQFITLNTNALAHSVDYYRKLFDAGLSNISISVDSLNQEIADLCRYGTRVEKLKQRILDLSAVFPRMTISIVASKLNLADIPDTLIWLNNLRHVSVEFQPVMDFKANTHQTNSLSREDISVLINNIRAIKQKISNVSLGFPPSMNISDKSSAVKCSRPFVAPYVTINGFLTPCCTIYDESLYGHSNLIRDDIEIVWGKPAVSDWLQSYIQKTPDICNGCCFNPQL